MANFEYPFGTGPSIGLLANLCNCSRDVTVKADGRQTKLQSPFIHIPYVCSNALTTKLYNAITRFIGFIPLITQTSPSCKVTLNVASDRGEIDAA